MKKIKLGLIGAGVIGKRHLKAMAVCEHIELVGIADPFVQAEGVAKEHGVPFFTDNEAMLEQCKPEGVIIATPTEHHLQPTLASLSAGAHVLVEKPIMATLEESEQVIALSEQCAKHLLVGHHRRYYSMVHQAREIVQSGQLGTLVAISGQWNVRKPDPYYDPEWRKGWKAGPILTNLIHEIDSLRYVCGDITSIMAETSNVVMGVEKEDAAALLIRFDNGALGSFMLSDQTNSPWSWEGATGENAAFPKIGENSVRIMGSKASLEFPNLVLWHHDGKEPAWTNEIKSERLHNELEDAFVLQLQHFGDVIRGTEMPRITARDASKTLAATVAVFEASRLGARVNL